MISILILIFYKKKKERKKRALIQRIVQFLFLYLDWTWQVEIATMMLLQIFCPRSGLETKDTSCRVCAYCYVYMLYTYDVLKLECDVKTVVGTNPNFLQFSSNENYNEL